jgi:hypothetical protein
VIEPIPKFGGKLRRRGFDPLLSRFEPRSFVFSRSTMSSRCSMPPQPDQLRRRHDRHDNGERATPLDAYRRRNGTKRKFFNDFSRARACACAQGKDHSESAYMRLNDGCGLDVIVAVKQRRHQPLLNANNGSGTRGTDKKCGLNDYPQASRPFYRP